MTTGLSTTGSIADASPAASSTAALVQSFDWSGTSLGPISAWSESLQSIARTVLASPSPMCLLIGRDGILFYNDGYAKIAGGRHPHILSMAATKAWPEMSDFNQQVIDRVIVAGECMRFVDERMVLNRNGLAEEVWLDLTYSPVPGGDGKPIAALALLLETTDRFRTKRELQRTSEQLSFTLAASSAVGAWDWDLVKNVVTSDARFAEMYGMDPDIGVRGAPIEHYVEGLHPDDRPLLEQRIAQAIETGEELRAEYRLAGKDGVRWVLALGRVVKDSSGQPVRLPGVVVDITDRKLQEEALAASEAGFRALADSMPQMVWSTRPDGFHDYYNARWYEFTGVRPGSTDGEGWNAIFHPDDQERAWAAWRHSLATGEPYQIEYRLRHHSGQYRWTLGRALPIRDAMGRITRWFGTCTDIHETKLVAEEREIVAQELSHRIKNIFSVLTGIISLSARAYPDVKPFADQLRERVHAMGKAHDFVRPHSAASQPTANQTSLRALIEQLLAAYHNKDNERVTFEGSDAVIDDGAATPLALLFHELATNAAKYGALSTNDGHVTLTGRDAGENYRMTWKETGVRNGIGKPETTGFGSRLISLSVEGQLGGKLDQHWEADGLRVELTLPVRALDRSAKLRKKAS